MVDVTDKEQACPERKGTKQIRHERHIDHRRLVHDQKVAVEWSPLISRKSSRGRLDFKQPVNRLRLNAGCLGEAFGCPPRGRTQEATHFLGPEDQQDRVDQRRFSDAWTARDDQGSA